MQLTFDNRYICYKTTCIYIWLHSCKRHWPKFVEIVGGHERNGQLVYNHSFHGVENLTHPCDTWQRMHWYYSTLFATFWSVPNILWSAWNTKKWPKTVLKKHELFTKNNNCLDQIERICRWQSQIWCCKNDEFCRCTENIVGKGENAGYQHFLLFPQCFQKLSVAESLKTGLLAKQSNKCRAEGLQTFFLQVK